MNGPGRTRAFAIRRLLWVVIGLNFLVAAAKLGYGAFSGSVAMSADGVQSAMDGLANIAGLVAIAIAARPPDRDHHYGHDRYETPASMAIAGLMAISVVESLWSAIQRLETGWRPEVSAASFLVLLGTMLVNAGVSWWERRASYRLKRDLLAADARRTGSEVLVSAAVVLGLALEGFGINGADAVISFMVAATIVRATWGIVRDRSLVLTAATRVDPEGLRRSIQVAPGWRRAQHAGALVR